MDPAVVHQLIAMILSFMFISGSAINPYSWTIWYDWFD